VHRPARTFVLPVPLSRMVAPYAAINRIAAGKSGTTIFIPVTNAVEALHRSLRKIIKTRGSFPNDDAALKLLYLAIKNAGMRWRRGIEWTAAMGQFGIQFGDRFPGTTR
jgi:putative transposase